LFTAGEALSPLPRRGVHMKRFLVSVAMAAVLMSPAMALELGGKKGVSVSTDRGGVSASVGRTKAKVGVGTNGSVADVDVKGPADTNVKATILGPSGVAKVTATSDLLDSINARLDVLSNENLLKLCLDIGGGDACNSGSRSELLGLIQSELDVLGPTSLANVCLSVGGTGCGGGAGTGGPGGGGGGGSGGLSNLSDGEIAALQTRCEDVLDRPRKYDRELIRLCRLIEDL
jgi:hypothetical protein